MSAKPCTVAAVDLGAASGRVMVAQVGPSTLELSEAVRFDNTPVQVVGVLHWDVLRLFAGVLDGLRDGSVDLETGEAGEALVERSDTAAVEALAVVAEACVAWELAAAAREKFGGDSLGDFVGAHTAYLERLNWQPRTR